MTAREDLHELIQSLNNREKQLISMASNGKQPNYLKLFHALCQITDFDEKEFLSSPNGAAFAKNFSVRKNELYEKILTICRSQRQFGGSEKPVEFQVRERLEDVRMLKEKGLFSQAFRRLTQAKKLAKRYELHEILVEALRVERFMVIDREAPGYVEKVEEIHREIAHNTAAISNKFRLLELKDRLFLVVRQFAKQSSHDEAAYLEAVIKDNELKDINTCLSFDARVNFHLCHSIYHHLSANAHLAWKYFREIYLLWLDNPLYQRTKIVEHRNTLQNYLNFSVGAKQYGDFDEVLEALEAGPFRSNEEEAATIFNVINVRLARYLSDCDWEKTATVEANFLTVEKDFGKHLHPSRAIVFALHFAWIHFILKNNSAAMKWLNRIENIREEDLRQGLIYRAKMMEVLVLFEAGEVKLLESRSRAIETAFSKTKSPYAFELKLVKVLNRYIGTNRGRDLRFQLEALLASLVENDLINAVQHSMTRVWLKSKIEQIAMKAIVEQERDEEMQ